MTATRVIPAPSARQWADDPIARGLKAEFLATVSWDPVSRKVTFPQEHPLLGWKKCRVPGCLEGAPARDRLCCSCRGRWRADGRPIEDYLADTRRRWRRLSKPEPCRVRACERVWRSAVKQLCTAHDHQRKNVLGLALEDFLRHPAATPLPSYGPCLVVACDRQRQGIRSSYCQAHGNRLAFARTHTPDIDEERWRRTTQPVSEGNVIGLLGMPDRVVAELLFGLQERTRLGYRTRHYQFHPLVLLLRNGEYPSLHDVDPTPTQRGVRGLLSSLVAAATGVTLSAEVECHKDVWDGRAFGVPGRLHFGHIHQPWLREAAKRWAADDLPQRRGARPASPVQDVINALARLSQSLRSQREDHGLDPRHLGAQDVSAFCNQLAHLQDHKEITARTRLTVCRGVRNALTRMRSLGLNREGEPLHGLSDDFALTESHIPDDPEDTETGKDLPVEVMRALVAQLGRLDDLATSEVRTAIELVIDTGRRPGEICALPWDCLERDGDGHPVLIYSNLKGNRHRRRLPIADATARLIVGQQERVRARFPTTPSHELALLPGKIACLEGRKCVSAGWVSEVHRMWIDTLDPIHVPVTARAGEPRTTVPFDARRMFLYAYRHSYAQRHADAGVPVDVLRELMDHRQMSTTQAYYRVGESRRREAVERVTAMQFDRHGTRVWRTAQALLDSEHTRRAMGEVTAPYGVCTEPSNVATGGHDCPVRFRCVGCGHFRTDISYLPDLEAYLADLLRNRERLAAFVQADGWAKAEAMPSDEEITRVRRLVRRLKEDLDELTDDDRTQIREAVTVVRRTRQVVSLGLPRIRQPLPDIRPDRIA
ncbi:site-specific integrase [Embleya sp. NPDC005575]|uniref:tyrosine-type recombinase/integrase n=1 Tax=Embleya sp. NPDC005575 TaxID=3156892 RepID=UPI0033A93DD1